MGRHIGEGMCQCLTECFALCIIAVLYDSREAAVRSWQHYFVTAILGAFSFAMVGAETDRDRKKNSSFFAHCLTDTEN